MYTDYCFMEYPDLFKATISRLNQVFNQSEGVHTLQLMHGCEWDEETGEVTGFLQYGYDGEDFLVFDLKTFTWISLKPQAISTKLRWDSDTARMKFNKHFFTHICPEWLKMYLYHGNSSLLRRDVPSVSLLQKTPSSPVSCHTTGFYPDRAMMFWRKDGEEIHEGVELGEILPNHDGSFQMNVDLDISSVSDWSKYDCVFQLSGVEDIVTKLDKKAIRSNEVNLSFMIIGIVAAAVILVAGTVIGLIVYKKKTAERTKQKHANPRPVSETSSTCSGSSVGSVGSDEPLISGRKCAQ